MIKYQARNRKSAARWQPNPGRRSTYRRGDSVQTTGTTSPSPVGEMQGSLNLRGYWEFSAQNRSSGWNTWLVFSIAPTEKKAPNGGALALQAPSSAVGTVN
jgi:hypothetical protein